MKPKSYLILLACLAVSLLAIPVMGQTLADAAREARKKKPVTPASPAHVYTNDSMNLQPAPTISTVPAGEMPAEGAVETLSAPEKDKPAGDSEAASTGESKVKLQGDLVAKISKASSDVESLKRELDLMQREDKIRVAQFYADAGNRLRNEKQYAEETRKIQATLADRQQKLAALQAKLDQLRNEARRAGVPAGQIP